MKYTPWRGDLGRIPHSLVRLLVEKCLDQRKPSKGLVQALQVVLDYGDHPDRRTQ